MSVDRHFNLCDYKQSGRVKIYQRGKRGQKGVLINVSIFRLREWRGTSELEQAGEARENQKVGIAKK